MYTAEHLAGLAEILMCLDQELASLSAQFHFLSLLYTDVKTQDAKLHLSVCFWIT
jgi:hypothetical protein